jgi:parallel beta helix pectate lyase-like protein
MKSLTIPLSSLAVMLWLAPSAAHAQATRTWVSGTGSDANPCSRAAPCQTFAGAIVKTFINGEIDTLDAGGFGAVTITKSITIDGDESFASILSSGTNGVIINIPAGNANDPKRRVHLRNLHINGTGASGTIGTSTGLNGIRVLAASQVIIENCLIQGFSQNGIDVNLSPATTTQIMITNTTITDIGSVGVRVTGAGSTISTVLNRVLIHKAGFGFDLLQGIGTVNDSTISHVTNQAIVAEGTSTINVNGGVVSNNGTGVSAFSNGSTVRIANLAILNNTTGITFAAGGTVASFGGNKNAGNTTPGAPNANLLLQ